MPELPDVTVYLEALAARVRGRKLLGVRLASPFVLRTFDPPLAAAAGKQVLALRRVGKRLVLELEGDLFLVMHLMIAGRLRWLDAGAKIPGQPGCPARMDRSAARRGGRRCSRKGHRLPRGDGGPRALPHALPGLRDRGAAHRLRRERDQLLPALPDGGADPLRPQPLSPPQGRLAPHRGGARGTVRKADLTG